MDEQVKECALKRCPEGKELWVFNGNIVKNLHDLVKSIKKQDDYTFRYHVNDENQKNDYAKWIIDVIGDRELGDRLLRASNDRGEFIETIKQRIRELEID